MWADPPTSCHHSPCTPPHWPLDVRSLSRPTPKDEGFILLPWSARLCCTCCSAVVIMSGENDEVDRITTSDGLASSYINPPPMAFH